MFDLKKRLGWKPEPPDARDLLLRSFPRFHKATNLPKIVSHREKQTPVRDQGDMNSCTGFALAAMREYYEVLDCQTNKRICSNYRLSPLFIYNAERQMRGWLEIDEGAFIRDGLKVLQKLGCESEENFQTDWNNFKKIPQASETSLQNCTYTYMRLENLDEIKLVLSMGLLVVCGLTVYKNWELPIAYQQGIIPMPAGRSLGGHAVLIVGYNDDTQTLEYKNSWGEKWGNGGYFVTDYSYIEHSGSDFWTIMKWR